MAGAILRRCSVGRALTGAALWGVSAALAASSAGLRARLVRQPQSVTLPWSELEAHMTSPAAREFLLRAP